MNFAAKTDPLTLTGVLSQSFVCRSYSTDLEIWAWVRQAQAFTNIFHLSHSSNHQQTNLFPLLWAILNLFVLPFLLSIAIILILLHFDLIRPQIMIGVCHRRHSQILVSCSYLNFHHRSSIIQNDWNLLFYYHHGDSLQISSFATVYSLRRGCPQDWRQGRVISCF